MSLGIVAFNSLTLLTRNVLILGCTVFVVLFIGTMLPLLEIEESPEFLLYSRESQKYMELVERYRTLNRVSENTKDKERFDRAVSDQMILLDTIGTPKQSRNKQFYKVVKLSKFIYEIFTLSLIGGFMNTTMSSIILNLGALSLTDISYNGIAIGGIGLLSNIILAPILNKMNKKKWLLVFQIVLLICGVLLLLIYKLTSRTSDIFQWANPIIAIILVGSIVNAMSVPYYSFISEFFPVDVRGTANSIILCIANLIPVATPWLCLVAEHLDVHFLVGSCLVGLISVPLTIFLEEDHDVDK